jgi:hypothetical protein
MTTRSGDRGGLDVAGRRERFVRDGYLVEPGCVDPDVARGWCRRAKELLARAVDVVRAGEDRLLYSVLTGDVIREEMAELYAFYASDESRAWVAAVAGEPEIHVSSQLRSAINVNILRPADRYRWHFDANPYTALLYLSDHEPGGGELELYPNLREGRRDDPQWDRHVTSAEHLASREKISIRPAAGTLVLIDGSVTYHRVAPVVGRSARLSAPLVYLPQQDETRPEHLDDYLYRSTPWPDASRENSAQYAARSASGR